MSKTKLQTLMGEDWNNLPFLEEALAELKLHAVAMRRNIRAQETEQCRHIKDECIICAAPLDWRGKTCALAPKSIRMVRKRYAEGNIFNKGQWEQGFPGKPHKNFICSACHEKRREGLREHEEKQSARAEEYRIGASIALEQRREECTQVVANQGARLGDRFRALGWAYTAAEREQLAALPYKEFLQTEFWKIVSRYVRVRAGKCQLCKAKDGLNTHHSTYEHHGWEDTHWQTDLIVLCKECHERHHEIVSQAATE